MPDAQISHVMASVKFFEDLAQLIVDAIDAAKNRSVWGALKLIPEIERVIVDAKNALPELAHLNPQDAMLVGSAAYNCVKRIVAAA